MTQNYVGAPAMSLEAVGVAVNMHISRAEVFQRAGRMAEALSALQQGKPILARALRRGPSDTYALTSAVSFYGVQARILGSNLGQASLGQWQQACAAAERATRTAETILRVDPMNQFGPDSLAFTVGEEAQCALLSGDSARSEALFRRQIELRDRMAQRLPDDMDFRYQRAIARGNRARALSSLGRHPEALALVDEALTLAQNAVAADPGNAAGPQRVLALQATRLELLLAAGHRAAARSHAAALLSQLPRGSAFSERRTRAAALIHAAQAWLDVDRPRAQKLAREAVSLLQGDDDNATRRWLLAQALTVQAATESDAGAVQHLKAAIRPLISRPPAPPVLRRVFQR